MRLWKQSHIRTATQNAAVFELTPLTVFVYRNHVTAITPEPLKTCWWYLVEMYNLVITITPAPFEIYILADVLRILCRMHKGIRGVLHFCQIYVYVQYVYAQQYQSGIFYLFLMAISNMKYADNRDWKKITIEFETWFWSYMPLIAEIRLLLTLFKI